MLFKASENKYSASRFHEECRNSSHTLTLIKTSFNKIIGGYTPLLWNAGLYSSYVSDLSKKSFIFSLDNLEKYDVEDHKKAVMCDKNYGPIFG